MLDRQRKRRRQRLPARSGSISERIEQRSGLRRLLGQSLRLRQRLQLLVDRPGRLHLHAAEPDRHHRGRYLHRDGEQSRSLRQQRAGLDHGRHQSDSLRHDHDRRDGLRSITRQLRQRAECRRGRDVCLVDHERLDHRRRRHARHHLHRGRQRQRATRCHGLGERLQRKRLRERADHVRPDDHRSVQPQRLWSVAHHSSVHAHRPGSVDRCLVGQQRPERHRLPVGVAPRRRLSVDGPQRRERERCELHEHKSRRERGHHDQHAAGDHHAAERTDRQSRQPGHVHRGCDRRQPALSVVRQARQRRDGSCRHRRAVVHHQPGGQCLLVRARHQLLRQRRLRDCERARRHAATSPIALRLVIVSRSLGASAHDHGWTAGAARTAAGCGDG